MKAPTRRGLSFITNRCLQNRCFCWAARRLRTCGDSLRTLEGVFSGSLSWLFNQYDGSQPFSVLLHEARRLGYTEPDPRSDLSGEDVARKLLIIARNAGFSFVTDEVDVQGLVPKALRVLGTEAFLARLPRACMAPTTTSRLPPPATTPSLW